jgi:hypothetical protein
MVRTNASAQFQNDAAFRGVISWFNRRNIPLVGADTANAATSATTPYVEINAVARVGLMTWGEEAVHGEVFGPASNTTAGQYCALALGVDGTVSTLGGRNTFATVSVAGAYVALSSAGSSYVTEGYHFLTPIAFVQGGTGNYFAQIVATIRG